ncbi:MAG: Uma2 family endonuclease [Caldilineales bacterium]|nr:Uma2 family endonuclease [Caldilineales bacterium]
MSTAVLEQVVEPREAVVEPPEQTWALPPRPDISHLVTEDDTPVDNIFSEKEQRLLTAPLYGAWQPGRPFAVFANVALYYAINQPPLVPDVFLSLDVTVWDDLWPKEHRSYFLWEFGKAPDVVIEIVSNRKGGERDEKMRRYEAIRIPYYVVYDPMRLVQEEELVVFEWTVEGYRPRADTMLPKVGLGLQVWEGVFEGTRSRWLRWCDAEGKLIPTADERAQEAERRAEEERRRAKEERRRAEEAERRAEEERRRAERLAARLRELGIEPEA